MPPRPRLFVYDFDGTLIDSALSSYECYREVFGTLGIGMAAASAAAIKAFS